MRLLLVLLLLVLLLLVTGCATGIDLPDATQPADMAPPDMTDCAWVQQHNPICFTRACCRP
jgi:hypothetical protein